MGGNLLLNRLVNPYQSRYARGGIKKCFSMGLTSNSKVGSHPYISMDMSMVKFDYLIDLMMMRLLLLGNNCTLGR